MGHEAVVEHRAPRVFVAPGHGPVRPSLDPARRLTLEAGVHVGYRFGADGLVTGHKRVRLPSGGAPVLVRAGEVVRLGRTTMIYTAGGES